MLFRGNQFKICVNLIIVAEFIRPLKGLQSCVNCIKSDLVLLNKVLHHVLKSLLAH